MLLLVLNLILPAMFAASELQACVPQAPQDFLIRANMFASPDGFQKAVDRAIRYRVGKYGYVEGAPRDLSRLPTVASQAVDTAFLGQPVRLHRKVVPVLACVEDEILRACPGTAYKLQRLSGLRTKNTYRGGEISNHMFGLAVDLDPDRNPCCGCVAPWSSHPKCKRPATSPYDRTDIPKCWVEAFERHGFYWLGWDRMQDTMHFEFLGDPGLL